VRVYPVRLPGKIVVVREAEEKDLPFVHEYATDAQVVAFMTWGPNSSLDQTRAILVQHIAEARATPRDIFELAVALPGSDELVGRVRLTVESAAHPRGDIGYVIRRAAWGHGYATEAARLVIAFGFEQLGLHRIGATCAPENLASVRVLEKLGMRREGQLRQHVLAHGAWRDSLVYGVLRDEWRA
jgi:RimJ/RimL family protein N-acetyltransferase